MHKMITAEYRLAIRGLYFNTIGFKVHEHSTRLDACMEDLSVIHEDYSQNRPEFKMFREANYIPAKDSWHCSVYTSEDFYAYIHGESITGHWTEGRYSSDVNIDEFKSRVQAFLEALKEHIAATFPEVSLDIGYNAKFYTLETPSLEIAG